MLLPSNIESKLRFSQIRSAVKSHCHTSIGLALVDDMQYCTDYEQIVSQVSSVAEMKNVLLAASDFPTADMSDIRTALDKIKVDGLYLSEDELLELVLVLSITQEVFDFFARAAEDEYPALRLHASRLTTFPLLLTEITKILDSKGEIRDTASPDLYNIRQQIREQEALAIRKLNAVLRSAQSSGLVEADTAVSIRGGLSVIPVPAANKRKIPGIVVDESSTGKTVFVQPAEIVAINSFLAELHGNERREIIRILKEVSANIRPYAPEIIIDCEVLGLFDFIRAKASYAVDIDAIMPVVENRQGLYLSAARHPILLSQFCSSGKTIVPLNIELEAPECRLLVISGPNAGGKSVCLQTVGLLQYMLQCGLLVPAAEGSKMGVFRNLFIDIGDDQSIENDLSTYSSHLTAMKNFVRGAGKDTLLLIDEFGTGTEPMLGGAIAESVLAELNRLGAFGVVTTHYTNLKHFAAQTKGLANGAMAFDTSKIEPLFTLHVGQPGSSFAFEIARKIGLPEKILQEAKEKMGKENADYDRNLRQIVRDKHYWEQKRQVVKDNDKRLQEILDRYEEMLARIKTERKEIISRAKEEAKQLLADANGKIENVIRQIREEQAEKSKTKILRADLQKFQDSVSEADSHDDELIERRMQQIRRRQQKRNEKRPQVPDSVHVSETLSPELPIAVGDIVMIDSDENCVGTVISLKGSSAQVSIGAMLTNVKLSRLSRTSKNVARRLERQQKSVVYSSSLGDSIREKKLTFRPEIDLRGLRAEEALRSVGNFIDEALLCDASQVRILHGKGNGILRSQIRAYLNSLPFVVDARDEAEQFGGAGITVVDLRD